MLPSQDLGHGTSSWLNISLVLVNLMFVYFREFALSTSDSIWFFCIFLALQLSGVMQFFGRLAMLVNENTQAFHFFISALLQVTYWRSCSEACWGKHWKAFRRRRPYVFWANICSMRVWEIWRACARACTRTSIISLIVRIWPTYRTSKAKLIECQLCHQHNWKFKFRTAASISSHIWTVPWALGAKVRQGDSERCHLPVCDDL